MAIFLDLASFFAASGWTTIGAVCAATLLDFLNTND